MVALARHRPARAARLGDGAPRAQRGFTVIEILIALTVLVIGIGGILALQLTAMRSTSFSRHATEASVLAEDLMEQLRTRPSTQVQNGTDTVNSNGVPDPDGTFTRTWTVTWDVNMGTIDVTVGWNERGSEQHAISLRTQRSL